MSCHCHEVTLPDGSKAIVRSSKRGWTPTQAELELIVKAREELLRICPFCHDYRHRCRCDAGRAA